MEAKGILRKVDELGRVVLPIELRRNMEINEADPMEIYMDGNMIVLQKYEPKCIFCGNTNELKNYNGKNICCDCISKM